MSSVGNSDSADRAADKTLLRKTRDEFRQRESELIKRQNVEARRTAERNSDEINTLKEQHAEQMNSARGHAHDSITEQDHRYQREIEGIRDLHRKQLQTSADETSQREKITARASKNDQAHQSKHNDERFEQLNSDFQSKSREESELYQDRLHEGREKQQEAVKTMREKLIDTHQNEMDSLRTTLQDKIAEEEGNFSHYRRETSAQRREAETNAVRTGHQQSEKLMSAVGNERLDRAQNEKHLREDYAESLAGERDRFAQALDEKDEGFAEAGRRNRTESEDRGTQKIDSLRRENKDLRSQNSRDLSHVKHAAGKELKNARDSFQKNVDAYRQERDEAYQRTNASERKDVREMRETLEKQARTTADDARAKMSDQTGVYKREFENVKNQYEDRIEQQNAQSEQRVEHILEATTDEKARLTQLNADNHEAAQRSQQDVIKTLRHSLEGDKRDQVDAMREMMRKQELRHGERMGSVVAKYDKQIQSLKDEMQRERRLSGETTKRSIDELQRAHQLDLDQAETKTRAKLSESNARHDQEVRNVSKRYEEKLDQMLAEMKKS